MKIGGGKRGAFLTKRGISEEKYSNQGRTNGVRSLLTLQAKISKQFGFYSKYAGKPREEESYKLRLLLASHISHIILARAS